MILTVPCQLKFWPWKLLIPVWENPDFQPPEQKWQDFGGQSRNLSYTQKLCHIFFLHLAESQLKKSTIASGTHSPFSRSPPLAYKTIQLHMYTYMYIYIHTVDIHHKFNVYLVVFNLQLFPNRSTIDPHVCWWKAMVFAFGKWCRNGRFSTSKNKHLEENYCNHKKNGELGKIQYFVGYVYI